MAHVEPDFLQHVGWSCLDLEELEVFACTGLKESGGHLGTLHPSQLPALVACKRLIRLTLESGWMEEADRVSIAELLEPLSSLPALKEVRLRPVWLW